ncbi:antiterminator Q family protein [Utexia brackfieldae]|uniref:antiterminator Q family protein n=1 Tax=Utexia brackfieldae TaxID=3074108 RepID=UPI00370D27C2
MRDIKEILTAWANVRVSKRIGTEYPFKTALIEGAKRDADYRSMLLEEEAEQVDKAVLRLKQVEPFLHSVLVNNYLNSISCSRQAKVTGMRTNALYEALKNAEFYILAKLDDKIHDIAA